MKYNIKSIGTRGISIAHVGDLKVKIIENFTFDFEFDRDYTYEIEVEKNSILFEVIDYPEDFNEPDKYPSYRATIDFLIEKYKSEYYTLSKLSKFEFYDDYIRHNLEPRFIIKVVKNDDSEYDKLNDVYDLFKFRGNLFALVIVASEIHLDEVQDFRLIRSIIKRAFNWYRSQVEIERYIPPLECGEMENEQYILQPSIRDGWWVCTDKRNEIVVKWQERLYNETQEVTTLNDDTATFSVIEIATIMRELADWLIKNHREKL